MIGGVADFDPRRHLLHGSIPRDLDRSYSKLSFGKPETRAGMFVAAAGSWDSAASIVYEHATAYLRDPRLGADRQEEEALDLKGFVNWRAAGPGCLSEVEDVVLDDERQADALAPTFERIGRENYAFIVRQGREWAAAAYFGATMPIDRGKGGVTCAPGTVKRVSIATTRIMRSATTRPERVSLQHKICVWRTLRRTLATIRLQNSKGPVPLKRVERGRVTPFGEYRGPKVRQIRIIPFEDQIDFMGLTNVVLEIDRILRPNWIGSKAVCTEHKRRFKYSFGSDKRRFDDGITMPGLMRHLELVVEPTLAALVELEVITHADAKRIMDGLADVYTYDCLLPPLDAHYAARDATSIGTMKSGLGPTNRWDTHFNAGHHEWKARVLGAGLMEYDVYGDDGRVSTNDPYLALAWADHGADPERNLGWEESVSPADTYGQAYIQKDGEPQVKPVRLMMSTAQKEERNEPRTVLEAAVGVRARIDLLANYPLGSSYYNNMLDDIASRHGVYQAVVGLARARTQSELGRLLQTGGQLANAARMTEWGTAFATLVAEYRKTAIWDEGFALPHEPTIQQLFAAADSLTLDEAWRIVRNYQHAHQE